MTPTEAIETFGTKATNSLGLRLNGVLDPVMVVLFVSSFFDRGAPHGPWPSKILAPIDPRASPFPPSMVKTLSWAVLEASWDGLRAY